MTPATAETTALQVLGWIAGQDDLLRVFLGASGAAADDLRAAAQTPELQLAVLDFILMDDAWVIDCCDALGLDYTALSAARAALPGGEQVHWT